MNTQNKGFFVRLLDKEYRVSCPDGAEQSLQDSANYLDSQMRAIQNTGRVMGLDRIAIMAGLNIAKEYLKRKNIDPKEMLELSERLTTLKDKIEQTLLQHKFTLQSDETKKTLL